jgi:hypothetical protein
MSTTTFCFPSSSISPIDIDDEETFDDESDELDMDTQGIRCVGFKRASRSCGHGR